MGGKNRENLLHKEENRAKGINKTESISISANDYHFFSDSTLVAWTSPFYLSRRVRRRGDEHEYGWNDRVSANDDGPLSRNSPMVGLPISEGWI